MWLLSGVGVSRGIVVVIVIVIVIVNAMCILVRLDLKKELEDLKRGEPTLEIALLSSVWFEDGRWDEVALPAVVASRGRRLRDLRGREE